MNGPAASILLFISGISLAYGAGSTHQFCIGEFESYCNVKPHYDCSWNNREHRIEEIPETMCTIHTPTGPQAFKYRMRLVSMKDGNNCGYKVYEVECLQP